MTVGECAGVTIEEAEKYASADGKELSMVFQFELVDLASGTYGKWTDKRVPLKDFKRVMTAWQTELEERHGTAYSLETTTSRAACPVSAMIHRNTVW